MKISEITGVPIYKEFKVINIGGMTFKTVLHPWLCDMEIIMESLDGSTVEPKWSTCDNTTFQRIISMSPEGISIVNLMSEEQVAKLKSSLNLGFRYMIKDRVGNITLLSDKPIKCADDEWNLNNSKCISWIRAGAVAELGQIFDIFKDRVVINIMETLSNN